MRRNRVILFMVSFLLLFGFAILGFAKEKEKEIKHRKDDLYDQIELFASAISIIRNDYVTETSSKDLIYGALKGMLMSLDSHSQFMDPQTFKEMKVETEGRFGGLGIEITIKDGILTIISPIEGTPAYKAGLRPNDKIVKIDGKSTKDVSLTEAVKQLRGEPGTQVTLTILREEEGKVLDFTITRGIIEIKSIKEAAILEDKIGYIKLVEFQENTPKDLAKALASLKAKGMNSLILDLRNNPGGLLDVSVEVAQMFLPRGGVVVSTKGRLKKQDRVYKANYGRPYLNFPLIVLVNEGSASASEIVAGAIKDSKRGIIVGTKTFGKGSVQTVIPLSDGSAIRLTTATYFTPSGQAINNVGIMPDVTLARPEKKNAEKEEWEEIEKEERKKEKEEEKKPDIVLERAIGLMKAIKAYEAVKTQQK